MDMNGLQKTVMITGLALLAGGSGLMVYDRMKNPERPAYSYSPSSEAEKEAMVKMREAEEYLRQSNRESTEKALDRFNSILARDIHPQLNQMSKLGLGVALEKLGDRRRALNHYRELKGDRILDPALKDRVNYRLGDILLSLGNEVEGRSLLEDTLATTADSDLKSDIHAAFGDHYRRQGQIRKARENYRIALDYDPDNLVVENRLRSLQNYYWNRMKDRSQETKKEAKEREKKESEKKEEKNQKLAGDGDQKDPGEQDKASQDENFYDDGYLVGATKTDEETESQKIQEIREETFEKGIQAFRAEKYDGAITHFRRLTGSYPDSDVTEKASYWLGEAYEKTGATELAEKLYRKTLDNKNRAMDQVALIKRGVLEFQRGDLPAARDSFQKATKDFADGRYTKRARQWLQETEAQLEEREMLKSYSLEGLQGWMNYFKKGK